MTTASGARFVRTTRPAWADWQGRSTPYSVGIEEESMLLDPVGWGLSQTCEDVIAELPDDLAACATAETHGSAIELSTGVHASVRTAVDELYALRVGLAEAVADRGLSVASAGTHPFAVWNDISVSRGERYQFLYGALRELARREPTHALHVHVGVPTPEEAMRAANRLRAHLPLLLALSGNSPYWQGRDSGLASARTPLFQAFPRVGVPRAFRDYDEWVETMEMLVRCDAFPDPSFVWWDVRLQPRFGTVEVRVMDAQPRVADTAGLAALVQALVRLELEEGFASGALLDLPEAIDENRFLAARDGMAASFVDPERGMSVPARTLAYELLSACEPHALDLGCARELAEVRRLIQMPGAAWQRFRAASGGLKGLLADLADAYVDFGR